jgi:hypothetical protein
LRNVYGPCAAAGDKLDLDAGQVVIQRAADDAVQAMLEPVEGQVVADLDGPEAILYADDVAGQQAVVKGGPGHLPAQGFQDFGPVLIH